MSEDSLFHDLEQRFVAMKKSYDLLCAEKDANTAKITQLTTKLAQANDKLNAAELTISENSVELKLRAAAKEEASTAEVEMKDRYRRRTEECERLREDLASQSNDLIMMQSKLRDAQLALSTAQSQELPMQYKMSTLTHENEVLNAKFAALQEESANRIREENSFHEDANGKISQLESSLRDANSELEAKTKKIHALEDNGRLQEEKIGDYLKKLQETESTGISQQGSLLKELDSTKRIVDLYKENFAELTKKVESLELEAIRAKKTHDAAIKALKDKVASGLEQAAKSADAEREAWTQDEAKLRAELEAAKQELQQRSQSSSGEGGAEAAVPVQGMVESIQNFDSVGITEMYSKVVAMEKELHAERAKRVETDMYIKKILQDVESKAPIIASQRRDYHRIVDAHTGLTNKLDQMIVENSELKNAVRHMEGRVKQADEVSDALTRHNDDLSSQIQHLLFKSMGGVDPSQAIRLSAHSSDPDGGVVSDYLVKFDDLRELQQRNAQLLQVVRKLSKEVDREPPAQIEDEPSSGAGAMVVVRDGASGGAGGGRDAEKNNDSMKEIMAELHETRESRKRTEDMVKVLVQQRDMYKAMAEDSAGGLDGQASRPGPFSPDMGAPKSPGSAMTPSATTPTARLQRVRELEDQIVALKEEAVRCEDRMNRLENAERLSSESLEKARAETINFRLEAAHLKSESRFQKERADRADLSLTTMQQESTQAMERRIDLERSLMDMQKDLRDRDRRMSDLEEKLRVAQETSVRMETDLELRKQSEERYVKQLADARDEISRHATLADNMQKIEAGLKNRAESEVEVLLQEKESMKKSYDHLRKQLDEKELIESQKMKAIDDELRTLRTKLEQKTSELATVQADFAREQSSAEAARERSAILEKQLDIAQERLSSSAGTQILSTIMTTESAAREVELEKGLAELQSLRAQLKSAEEHTEQFRKISVSAEAAFKQLRSSSSEAKALLESQLAAEREAQRISQDELRDLKTTGSSIMTEIEKMREEAKAAKAQHGDVVKQLNGELSLSKQESEQLKQQLEVIKKDIVKFQEAAKAAYGNYERELQLHAAAETSLKQARDEVTKVKLDLSASQHTSSELSVDNIRKEQALQEERNRSKAMLEEVQANLTSLQHTNDLLHSQVQSYGVQIERLQESRVESAIAASESSSTEAGASSDDSEMSDLRKSAGEMREVLRYMKKEKEMLDAKLSVVEQESQRYKTEVTLLNKALDEAKASLKKEIAQRTATRSETEYQKLMAEVSQVTLVRESNAHLRGENELLAGKIKTLTTEMQQAKAKLAPLEGQVRTLSAVKDSLENVNDQLTNDVSYWRDRLQALVTRYNDVDPEEHRLLKERLDEAVERIVAEKVSAATEAAKAKAETDTLRQEKQEKVDELATCKKQLEVEQSSSERVRENARKIKTSLIEMKSAKTAVENEIRELQAQVIAKDAEIEAFKGTIELFSSAAAAPATPAAAQAAAAAATITTTTVAATAAAAAAATAASTAAVTAATPVAATPVSATPVAATPVAATPVPVPAATFFAPTTSTVTAAVAPSLVVSFAPSAATAAFPPSSPTTAPPNLTVAAPNLTSPVPATSMGIPVTSTSAPGAKETWTMTSTTIAGSAPVGKLAKKRDRQIALNVLKAAAAAAANSTAHATTTTTAMTGQEAMNEAAPAASSSSSSSSSLSSAAAAVFSPVAATSSAPVPTTTATARVVAELTPASSAVAVPPASAVPGTSASVAGAAAAAAAAAVPPPPTTVPPLAAVASAKSLDLKEKIKKKNAAKAKAAMDAAASETATAASTTAATEPGDDDEQAAKRARTDPITNAPLSSAPAAPVTEVEDDKMDTGEPAATNEQQDVAAAGTGVMALEEAPTGVVPVPDSAEGAKDVTMGGEERAPTTAPSSSDAPRAEATQQPVATMPAASTLVFGRPTAPSVFASGNAAASIFGVGGGAPSPALGAATVKSNPFQAANPPPTTAIPAFGSGFGSGTSSFGSSSSSSTAKSIWESSATPAGAAGRAALGGGGAGTPGGLFGSGGSGSGGITAAKPFVGFGTGSYGASTGGSSFASLKPATDASAFASASSTTTPAQTTVNSNPFASTPLAAGGVGVGVGGGPFSGGFAGFAASARKTVVSIAAAATGPPADQAARRLSRAERFAKPTSGMTPGGTPAAGGGAVPVGEGEEDEDEEDDEVAEVNVEEN